MKDWILQVMVVKLLLNQKVVLVTVLGKLTVMKIAVKANPTPRT